MAPIDPPFGARGAAAAARPMDIAPRPHTGRGRISPSSMANRASHHSHQNPDAMAAWHALLASSPSLNPGLRAEPERRKVNLQHATALVDEFRIDLYNKTAMLSRATVGLTKTSSQRIAARYIGMLSQEGYFAQRTDWLVHHATEGWLQKGKKMLRQHGYIQLPADKYRADDRQPASDLAIRRLRTSTFVPRKRDILFKLELFTVCPYEYSSFDLDVPRMRESPPAENKNIALFRHLLTAWQVGPADFGVAHAPERFEAALVATARQTPRPHLVNLLELASTPDAKQWVHEEARLRPLLKQRFDAVINAPAFAQRYRCLVAQEKARSPQCPTPAQARAQRHARRQAHAQELLRAAEAAQKRANTLRPAVAQSQPNSV